MEVELFNILKTGSQEKVRVRKQEFQQRRTLISVDPHNEVFWIFHGTEVDPEIIRVTQFALDDLIGKYGKFKQVSVEQDEYNEKSQYLIGLFKNPELALADGKVKIKEKKVQTKVLSGGAASGIPKVAIAVTNGNKKVVPKAEMPEGRVETIDEFQITYYEGGRIVIDDLEEDLASGKNHKALISHLSLINNLVKDGATIKEALDALTDSLNDMVEEIFPEKKAKKTTEKAKKSTKKTTKKSSKKVEEEVEDEDDEEEEEEKPKKTTKKKATKAKKTTKKAKKTTKKSSKKADADADDDEEEEKPKKKTTKKKKTTSKKKTTKKKK